MIYLSSFKLSPHISANPNIYPDHVFRHMAGDQLFFDRITVLYGSNGSGKSSLLNLIANKLGIVGAEKMAANGHSPYVQLFLDESSYALGRDEQERDIRKLPEGSRYIKSEDILYEIKKIQMLPGRLYLLDEPETSLSPQNQIRLAEQINELARYLDSQFIIASHSPFMLGTLHAKIYNLDASVLQTTEWFELDNVRFFHQFFNKHRRLFE